MKSRAIFPSNRGPSPTRDYQRAGTYMVGFLTRQHLVTVDALADYWRQTFSAWLNPVPSQGYLSRAESRDD